MLMMRYGLLNYDGGAGGEAGVGITRSVCDCETGRSAAKRAGSALCAAECAAYGYEILLRVRHARLFIKSLYRLGATM